jgi:tetratricopeptide (TPR) repeat protein
MFVLQTNAEEESRLRLETMAHDWFRKTTWSEADQKDFFDRLKRSRTAENKAQYLRIQAAHLEQAGRPEFLRAALVLLEKILTEFPETFELSCAYSQKASCLAKLGEINEALSSYRLVFDTQRKFRTLRTYAHVEFGKFVVANKLTQSFDEALTVLDEFEIESIEFPRNVFDKSGIRAIIAAQRGEIEKAQELARTALEAASKIHSGLRYHATIGLVQDKNTPFYKSLQAILRL